MYNLKTIKKALKLLKQYDYKFIKVSRAMNIKVNTLRSWYKKEINNIQLVTKTRNKKSKWSNEYKKEILDYYFKHGENLNVVARKYGNPSYSTIKRWVRDDPRYKQKHYSIGHCLILVIAGSSVGWVNELSSSTKFNKLSKIIKIILGFLLLFLAYYMFYLGFR